MSYSLSLMLSGQTIDDGIELYKNKEYESALIIFESIADTKKGNIVANYFAGIICLSHNNFGKAITHLKRVVQGNFLQQKDILTEGKSPRMLLATAYYYDYQFASVIDELQRLKESSKEMAQVSDHKSVDDLMSKAQVGNKMIGHIEKVVFLDSVIVDKNELLQVYPSDENIGYISSQKEDDVAQQLMVFVSGKKDFRIIAKQNHDRGTDLYHSNRYLSGWSNPILLSENINSTEDENYPFMLSDGITLFFASKRADNNLGGYDIFMAGLASDGNFLKPQNIGMPFNSPANDYMLIVDEVRHIGYFATDRNMPKDKVIVYAYRYTPTKELWGKEDSLAILYAKNIVIDGGKTSVLHNIRQKNTTTSISTDHTFNFIVNHTTVYHQYSDFTNEVALSRFKDWEALESQIYTLQQQLLSVRMKYHNHLDIYEKEKLGQVIATTEQEYKALTTKANRLAKEVRLLERGNGR